MAGRRQRGVDPFASTDPPKNPAEAQQMNGGASPSAAVGEIRTGEELVEGQPTRVEAQPDLLRDEAQGLPRLVVIGGADRGKEFPVPEGESSVGRGLENNIVLADIAVSRHHTLVVRRGAQYELRDLGSGNGTMVNGERVETLLLRGGDQIELGNTLLRFVNPDHPSAAIGEAATQVGEGVASPRASPPSPSAVPTMNEVQVVPEQRTQRRKGRLGRSAKILIFGSLTVVVFLGLLLAAKLVLRQRAQGPPVAKSVAAQSATANAAASVHFDRGRKHLRDKQWNRARDEFEKVYALAPRFDHAKRYIRQAKAEARARRALDQSKQALSDGAFDLGRAQLAKIPTTSAYSTELPGLKQKIDNAQAERLLERARALRDSRDFDRARKAVEQALRIAPEDAQVRQLLDQLNDGRASSAAMAGRSSSPRARSPKQTSAARGSRRAKRDAPRVRRSTSARSARPGAKLSGSSRRVLQSALALYKKMEWDAAAALLTDQAEKAKGSARKRALEQRAKAMRQAGAAYQSALVTQTRDPARAIRSYKQAIAADTKASGGVHKKQFEQRLYKVARLQAISGLSGGRYHAAYQGLKLARRYGALDGQLKRVQETLESKAMDLFTKGYTIRSRNLKEARRLWQRALRMASPESAAYQKAYKWLNDSMPDYLDEDEL